MYSGMFIKLIILWFIGYYLKLEYKFKMEKKNENLVLDINQR